MYTHETTLRVRYSETDQMGYVYYGQYAAYFEVGRVEAMRALGMPYAEMESTHGILMPVMNLHVRYLRPALYDDELKMLTTIPKLPEKEIIFRTEIFRPNGKLAAAGRVSLCVLEAESHKRIEVPAFVLEKLNPHFGDN